MCNLLFFPKVKCLLGLLGMKSRNCVFLNCAQEGKNCKRLNDPWPFWNLESKDQPNLITCFMRTFQLAEDKHKKISGGWLSLLCSVWTKHKLCSLGLCRRVYVCWRKSRKSRCWICLGSFLLSSTSTCSTFDPHLVGKLYQVHQLDPGSVFRWTQSLACWQEQ